MAGPDASAAVEDPVQLQTSRQFVSWLAEMDASVLFTTYQAGKLFLLGHGENDQLSVFQRSFSRCMGLNANAERLYLSTTEQIWRLQNYLDADADYHGHDTLYVPTMSWVTGDLDVHDIGVDANGRLVFVNTLFSCLATISESASFVPIWQPSYISRLAAEDRCHLNGLAMRDGKPRYVTSVAKTDVADGWREHRGSGGLVIDIDDGAIVAQGLSMPHSPRWYADRLWVLNSGCGEFGYVDLESQKFVPVAFCPGYLRGLSFIGHYAIVGLSRPRHDNTFNGLEIDDRLAQHGVQARCGLQVIDLRSGDSPHWLRIDGLVMELYDVAMVPGIRRPAAIGFQTDEIRRTLRVGDKA